VYGRVDGKVMAMKLIQVTSECKRAATIPTSISTFKCADGNVVKINMFNDIKLYRTIEDCIKGKNHIDSYYRDFTPIILEECGFSHEIINIKFIGGFKQLGITKYFWNGYDVEPIHIPHSYFDFIFTENECIVLRNSNEYVSYVLYDTEEDCRKEHFVKVVTF
jgi:hypothetical protein